MSDNNNNPNDRPGNSPGKRPATARTASQTNLAPSEAAGGPRTPSRASSPSRMSFPALSPASTTRQSFPALSPASSHDRGSSGSVRIRRLPSSNSVARASRLSGVVERDNEEEAETRPRRSFSAPQRPPPGSLPEIAVTRTSTNNDLNNHLSTVDEEESKPAQGSRASALRALEGQTPQRGFSQGRGRQRASTTASRLFSSFGGGGSGASRRRESVAQSEKSEDSTTVGLANYDDEIVDMLDVIDPEVATLNTLNNVQNSLVIPNLGRFLNRRPTYDLSRHTSNADIRASPQIIGPLPPRATLLRERSRRRLSEVDRIPSHMTDRPTPLTEKPTPVEEKEEYELPVETPAEDQKLEESESARLRRTQTLKSVLSSLDEGEEHNYAVLPHGVILEGWSEEDKAELNDHVRHLLHSRKEKFKRSMRAFGKYIRQPLGFFVTLYAFLITFWGAAWVLFLIGWISVSGRQDYFIEICDQVLTALFCVVGIGMAPFRAVDTYHMIYIAHYHYLTWRLRRERGLPELSDPNELPVGGNANAVDLELAREKTLETSVLSPEQQRKLMHHQTKFSKSHTFYKPHETFTHRAFSVKILIAVVVLLDFHSFFQMALGGTTWGIYYKKRGHIITTVILCFSISCNITAGLTISAGDKRARKKLIVEQIFRQGVTEHALHQMQRERGIDFDRTEEGARQRAQAKVAEKERRDWLKVFKKKAKKSGEGDAEKGSDEPGAEKGEEMRRTRTGSSRSSSATEEDVDTYVASDEFPAVSGAFGR